MDGLTPIGIALGSFIVGILIASIIIFLLKHSGKSVDGLDKQSSEKLDRLQSSIEKLEQSTLGFQKILDDPIQLGHWAEDQMDLLLQHSGLKEGIHYERATVQDGRYPDLRVNLPNGRKIIVDSKATIKFYKEAVHEKDPEMKKNLLIEHANKIKEHIDRLEKKKYEKNTDSLDFVIMFLPIERSYNAAIEHNPKLFEYAVEKGIFICTPFSFISLLRTINFGWSQHHATQNARDIMNHAKDLYKSMSTLSKNLSDTRASLNAAVKKFDSTLGTFNTTFYDKAKKLSELNVSHEEISPPEEINARVRRSKLDETSAQPDQHFD